VKPKASGVDLGNFELRASPADISMVFTTVIQNGVEEPRICSL
jgi:hypothetical protein